MLIALNINGYRVMKFNICYLVKNQIASLSNYLPFRYAVKKSNKYRRYKILAGSSLQPQYWIYFWLALQLYSAQFSLREELINLLVSLSQ